MAQNILLCNRTDILKQYHHYYETEKFRSIIQE